MENKNWNFSRLFESISTEINAFRHHSQMSAVTKPQKLIKDKSSTHAKSQIQTIHSKDILSIQNKTKIQPMTPKF